MKGKKKGSDVFYYRSIEVEMLVFMPRSEFTFLFWSSSKRSGLKILVFEDSSAYTR